MVSKFLVIIVGHNYLQPLEIVGDIDVMVQKLAFESKDNCYIYSLHKYNEHGYWVSFGTIYKGRFNDKEGCRVDGLRIHR